MALDELTEPALGGLQLRREDFREAGPTAHLGDELFEPLALVVVDGAVLVELVDVGVAGLGVTGEPAAEGPRLAATLTRPTGRLDRHDLRCRGGEQLAVVADVQHGLARRPELAFQPALGIDVEEVVGLVEEQDIGVAAQQHLEGEALLLATRERPQRSIGNLVERQADGTASRTRPNAPRRGIRRRRSTPRPHAA